MNAPILLAALSVLAAPAAFAQVEPAREAPLVIRVETIEVTPEPQEREPRRPGRWERFAAALGPGRSARPQRIEMRFNDGSRAECVERFQVTSCEYSGQFTLVGNRTWTGR